MKKPVIIITVLVVLVFGYSCGSKSSTESVDLSIEEVAVEIIEAAGTCTLISLDSAGHPRARVMDPFPPEEELILWFGTNELSRKVKEILNDNRVTVIYYDKPSGAYASVYGEATIIKDLSSIEKYWKKSWNDFYPNYPKGYALIKVIPQRLEIISEKHGITGDPITWQPATITY